MTIQNGQPVDAAASNPAWLSRKVDTETVGVLGLNNVTTVESGAVVANTQRAINKTFDTSGITGEADATAKTYSSDNYVADGDDRKVAIGKLDTRAKTNADDIIGNASDIAAIENSIDSANGICPLDGDTKVPISNLPDAVLGAVKYQGTWDASTNTPTLVSGTGTEGHYYIVSVAGTTNIDGNSDWQIGDWIVFNGTAWEKIDNSDKVSSVNTQTGVVVLDTEDIAEGTGLTSKYTVKHNLAASTDPASTDDSGSLYSVGSLWINQTSNTSWSCTDNTSTAAVWEQVGGGGSGGTGYNYVENSDFEDGIDNWSTVSSSTHAISLDTTSRIRGTNCLKIAKASGSNQGNYVYPDYITLEAADTTSIVVVEFDGDFTDSNYVSGDMVCSLFDATNSNTIAEHPIQSGKGHYRFSFQTSSATGDYYLQFKQFTNVTYAYDVFLDSVVFKPQDGVVVGPAGWKQYDLSVTGTNWSSVKAVGVPYKTLDGTWRMSLNIGGAFSSATSNSTISVSGVSFSSFSANGRQALGVATPLAPTSANEGATISSSGDISLKSASSTTEWLVSGDVELSSMPTFAEDYSNVVLSESTSNREIIAKGASNGGTSITANTTDIDFTETVDNSGSWNGTQFTAPEDGEYQLEGSIFISSSLSALFSAYIDGSIKKAVSGSVTSVVHKISGTVGLKRGEVLSIRSNSPLTLSASTSLHTISITKLNNGVQTIAQSERVLFKGNNSAGLSIVNNNAFICSSVVTDSHGAYSSTTGVYDIRKDGYLTSEGRITSATYAYAAGDYLGVALQINGSTVEYQYIRVWAANTNNAMAMYVFKNIQVSVGDTAKIIFLTDITSSLSTDSAANTQSFTVE